MVVINEGLVFAVAITAWIGYRVLRRFTAGRASVARELLASLFFAYLCGVAHVTFFPMNIVLYAFDPYDANLIPFTETMRMLQYPDQPGVLLNLVGNLVLLAPLGIFLPLLFPRVRRVGSVLGVGLLVSLGIELFQLTIAIRVFDVDDILINSLGVLLGFLVYALLNRVAVFSRLFAKFIGPPRPASRQGLFAYTAFVLAAFMAIYSAQFIQQTQTEKMILANLSQAHRQLLGSPQFGDFLIVFSQTDQGTKVVETYRRVFFNRYTLFETHDNLQLAEENYTVSGMSTGHAMNYFVIARSRRPISAMTSYGLQFPVAAMGEYYFSYARLPIDSDRFFSFHFVDANGVDLGLSMEQ